MYEIECFHTLGTPHLERLKVTALNLFHPTASPPFRKVGSFHITTQPPCEGASHFAVSLSILAARQLRIRNLLNSQVTFFVTIRNLERRREGKISFISICYAFCSFRHKCCYKLYSGLTRCFVSRFLIEIPLAAMSRASRLDGPPSCLP